MQDHMSSYKFLHPSMVAKIDRRLAQAYRQAQEEPNQCVVFSVHFKVESDAECNCAGNAKMGAINQADRAWTPLGRIVDGQLEFPGMGVLSDLDPEEAPQESEQPERNQGDRVANAPISHSPTAQQRPLQYAVGGRR